MAPQGRSLQWRPQPRKITQRSVCSGNVPMDKSNKRMSIKNSNNCPISVFVQRRSSLLKDDCIPLSPSSPLLSLSSDPATISAVRFFFLFGGVLSAVCAWLYVSLLSLMRVDITGAEGDRGGFGCSDVQQRLELDCCIPKNRGTAACCSTKLDMSNKYQIHCVFIHTFLQVNNNNNVS